MPVNDLPDASRRKDLTIRLTLPQWARAKALAVDLESSVQQLVVAGLNRIFEERGLEPLDPESTIVPPTKRRKPRGA